MVHRGLEAISGKDGAWYDVDCRKSKIVNTPEGPRVRVRFRPIQDNQCSRLELGANVLGLASFMPMNELKWQDATITEIKREKHGSDECSCSFKLNWKFHSCPDYRRPEQQRFNLSSLCFISKPHEHLSNPYIIRWTNELLKRLQPADGVKPGIDSYHRHRPQSGSHSGGTKIGTSRSKTQLELTDRKRVKIFQARSGKADKKGGIQVFAKHLDIGDKGLPKRRFATGLRQPSKKRKRDETLIEDKIGQNNADVSIKNSALCEEHESNTSSQTSTQEYLMDQPNHHNPPGYAENDIKAMDVTLHTCAFMSCQKETLHVDTAESKELKRTHGTTCIRNLQSEQPTIQEDRRASPGDQAARLFHPHDGTKPDGVSGSCAESLQQGFVASRSGDDASRSGPQKDLHSTCVTRVSNQEKLSRNEDSSDHTQTPFQPFLEGKELGFGGKAQAGEHGCQIADLRLELRYAGGTGVTSSVKNSIARAGRQDGEVQSMHVNDGRVCIDGCNELLGFPYVIDSVEKKVQATKTCGRKECQPWAYNTSSKPKDGQFLQMLKGLMNGQQGMSGLELLHLAATTILDPGCASPHRYCDDALTPNRHKAL